MTARLALAALAALALVSCSTTESSTGPWEGGAKFERGTMTAIADVNRNAEALSGKQVQIEGTVKKMCSGKGCWVEVSDGSQTVLAKSVNDAILFPKGSEGRKVLVQGIVRFKAAESCEGSDEGSGSGGGGHECPKGDIMVEIQGAQLP